MELQKGNREDFQLIEKRDLDYPFAKFNKVIDIIEYTDEDYEKYLTGRHTRRHHLEGLKIQDVDNNLNRHRLE